MTTEDIAVQQQIKRLEVDQISRVTTNRDRIRCYRCKEYDHFANECPNTVADDCDGYESDRVALQLMTAEAEIHDNFETTRLNKEPDYLNL